MDAQNRKLCDQRFTVNICSHPNTITIFHFHSILNEQIVLVLTVQFVFKVDSSTKPKRVIVIELLGKIC